MKKAMLFLGSILSMMLALSAYAAPQGGINHALATGKATSHGVFVLVDDDDQQASSDDQSDSSDDQSDDQTDDSDMD